MNTVHVALCFSDASGGYYRHALVTAVSVFANTRSNVCLHLVHDETLSSAARAAFERLCTGQGRELRLHPIEGIPAETEENVLTKLGRGALFKTALPRLVSEKKILYLDCDIVCNADVAEIYGMDISGYYLGALPLTGEQNRCHRKRLGLRGNACINSGVLLMNLEKIRTDIPDYTEQIFAIVRNYAFPLGDQGPTNIFFDGKPNAYLFLPEKWNFRTEQKDNATLPLGEYAGKVVHFVGKKPWHELSTPGIWYWKHYAAAFPEEKVFAKMTELAPYEQERLLSFLMRNESLRRWVKRLLEVETQGIFRTLKARLTRK